MTEIEWIKIDIGLFDNPKIKYIRSLPGGDTMALLWIKLLTMAGRCNDNGRIFLTENMPYTPQLIADEANIRKTATVTLALRSFQELGMITIENGFIFITGWGKYQNVKAMDEIREKNRERVAKHRAKQKALAAQNPTTPGQLSITDPDCNVTSNVTSNESNAPKKENKEKEKEKESDSEGKKSKKETPPDGVTDAAPALGGRETWRQRIVDALAEGDMERAKRYEHFAQMMHYDLTVESIAAELRAQKGAGA